jgi:cytosine deaminase
VAETGFAVLPDAPRFVLRNATLPAVLAEGFPGEPNADGLVAADIVIANGKIERLSAAASEAGTPSLDMSGGMAWPTFVDMHTHIDKGHIWPRMPNPDGTFIGALEAVRYDRETRWSAADVAHRMDFSLRCAYAHGTSLLRTHIDSAPPQHKISWPVFADMRARWKGRVELQGVALFAIDAILDHTFAGELVDILLRHGGILGAATFMIPELDDALELLFRLALENDLDLDVHVDESEDPAARSLRHRFPRHITVGHCCALALQPADEAEATMVRVREAGISVVSLPMCNLYLQDRHAGRTPRWRGVTLLHEMKERGIPVAVASDNTRDPFYAYGDMDMVEVFREAVRVLHLDHPIAVWPLIAASGPARIMDRPEHGTIAAGRPADLVLFRARSWTELLARPQADRTVLRSGRAIDRTLPDFRELDDLMRGSAAAP